MTMSNSKNLPEHVGIILDGNRRWAKEQGAPAIEGHRQGMDVLKNVSFHAFDKGIKYLTAYIFSTENWQRAEEEVNYLMDLTVKAVERYLSEFHEHGVRVVVLGRRKGVRKKVMDAITRAEEQTKNNTNGTLALCFNYSGREEVVDALKQIIAEGLTPDQITADVISGSIYNPEIPDVDLIIRTSGERRTSGFMMYRAAYAELLFLDKNWPDFGTADFDKAVADYEARDRRYGV